MIIRMKNISNKVQRKYKETHHTVTKKSRKRWDYFLQKGHEKMVVMFIPHDGGKIFSFHISKFTVMFFTGLLTIILITSSFAIVRNTQIKSEEEKLMSDYKDINSQLLRYQKMTYEISENVEKIKPEIQELYELAAGSDEAKKIWDHPETPVVQTTENNIDQTEQKKEILPDEIIELRKLQKDILCASNTVKTIKNFVDIRNKVIYDTPSVVPNSGHITSLFGWRRSPFGFGRDFHTGIDIAAPGGTPIQATAPGTVTMTGWAGGYGLIIRIQHKYGFMTYYAHCSRIIAQIGDTVKKGQIIGYVGQTGASTGNHCHYEVRLGDVPINPYPYMSRMW